MPDNCSDYCDPANSRQSGFVINPTPGSKPPGGSPAKRITCPPIHKWRDWPAGKNLITGPQVHINGQGELAVSGKKLLTLSANQWHRIIITCGLGTHATGTWKLSVESPNEAAQLFPALTCSPAFKRLD